MKFGFLIIRFTKCAKTILNNNHDDIMRHEGVWLVDNALALRCAYIIQESESLLFEFVCLL